MTYRAELSDRALKQIGGCPPDAFDALISVMSEVIEYPEDTLRTFPTSNPYARCAAVGAAGLVSHVIDDAREPVTLIEVIWAS